MKRARHLGIIVTAVVIGALSYWWSSSARLPHIKMKGGGEFRVYKICYGGPDDHQLARSPRVILSAWNHLPTFVQHLVPQPNFGDSGESPLPGYTAVSVYWGWIERGAKLPAPSPTDPVIMTTDSGQEFNLGWAFPFDASDGGSYRQILIMHPPTDSRRLRFNLSVEDEKIEFAIDNPAYGK